ncbi:MAG: hypothetical protein FRX49_13020 [Trebouxia sp. A1-2]|nr:MAG: hypothetical protein FRX49_13020 [Trebouxia sp. A1-2]
MAKVMQFRAQIGTLGMSAKRHVLTHLRPVCGDHGEANVHNGHEDEEEVKLVPAITPVAAPSQAGDLDGSFNNEDCCEAVVASLLGIGESCGLVVNGGGQNDDVDHNDCCDDVVEVLLSPHPRFTRADLSLHGAPGGSSGKEYAYLGVNCPIAAEADPVGGRVQQAEGTDDNEGGVEEKPNDAIADLQKLTRVAVEGDSNEEAEYGLANIIVVLVQKRPPKSCTPMMAKIKKNNPTTMLTLAMDASDRVTDRKTSIMPGLLVNVLQQKQGGRMINAYGVGEAGCEGEGNDLEEGFHTKDSCDASIQSIDDLSHTKSSWAAPQGPSPQGLWGHPGLIVGAASHLQLLGCQIGLDPLHRIHTRFFFFFFFFNEGLNRIAPAAHCFDCTM